MIIDCDDFQIYLQTLSMDDAEAFAKNINDIETIKNVSNRRSPMPFPYTKEKAMAFIETLLTRSMEGYFVNFSIRRKDNKKFVGAAGIGDINHIDRNGSILFWTGKEHRRNGYARQAIRLLLFYAFKELNFHKVKAEVYSSNLPSISLLKSLKFKNEGTLLEEYEENGKFYNEEILAILENSYKDNLKAKIKE
ncbi:MAG: GNAT family N-acetyltransferase [Candidatus Marsarchaeota archaeon]|nr:GNAT family N-acetyltransferase [Candidatus Marsarchaeota archaeon]